jgi:flagellin
LTVVFLGYTASRKTDSFNPLAPTYSIDLAESAVTGDDTNRLEHTIANLGTSSENMTSAESRIRDVDMAKEMMQFQKNNILAQAATAMLAQANQQPQGVLNRIVGRSFLSWFLKNMLV